MTISQAVSHFDTLTPNQIGLPVKVAWLSRLDGQICKEVLSTHEGTAPADFAGYTAATDVDTVLLVPHPYDEIYRWYLEMMVWDTMSEMAKYNNAAQKYNTALVSYMDHINRTCTPKGCRRLRLV